MSKSAENLNTSYYRDYDALPILFLYNNSIELFLKSIIMVGLNAKLNLEVTEKSLFDKHNLNFLFLEVEKIFQAIKGGLNSKSTASSDIPHIPSIDKLDEIKKLIDEVDNISKGSVAFRFPLSKHKNDIRPNFRFNILHVSDKLSQLCELLREAVGAVMNNLEPQY